MLLYTSFIVLSYILVGSCNRIVYPCITPNDERVYCVSLFSCPILIKALSSLEPSSLDFVKKSICLGCKAGDFMVCCGKAGNYLPKMESHMGSRNSTQIPTANPTTSTTPDRNAFRESQKKLLPSRNFCGFQHTDDRFYNETNTALDEFPWLVHILITDVVYEEEFGDRCTGVLISKRYVLTDAHCGAEALKVKLGEYNTSALLLCIGHPENRECSDPTLEVRVSNKVQRGTKANGPYDLTLLRLAKDVVFTDFVRPICLPVDGSLRPISQNTVIFSGWGATDSGGIAKKRLEYAIVSDQVCYNFDGGIEGNIKFANVTPLCASPLNNTDTACHGERGGPYMYSHKHQWFAEGIIVQVFSYDEEQPIRTCSKKNPVSGIRITPDMMNWILDTIYK